jgi:ribonuclease HI
VGPMTTMDKLFVYIDGRAEHEPGEAAIGVAITDKDGNVVEEVSRLIGRATSRIARYRALIEGARHALAYSPQSIILFTDDQRLVNHITGMFSTREPHLNHLLEVAKGVLDGFPEWRVNFVDRDANRRAPRLVERAFHSRIQAKITRKHLELRLLARVASLSDGDLERVIEYAEHLQSEG